MVTSRADDADADRSPPTRVGAWLDDVAATAADQDLRLLVDLVANFQHLVDHTREVDAGEYDPQSQPNFGPGPKELVYKSALFGAHLLADEATLYVLLGADDRFVGLYGIEDNARERVHDEDANGASLHVRAVSPKCRVPERLLERMLDQAEGTVYRVLGDCLLHIANNRDDFLDALDAGDFELDALPAPQWDAETKFVLVHSVVFGMAWEASYPSLWAVLDGQQFRELHHSQRRARERADRWPGTHAQRVSVADGDLPPGDVISEMPNVGGGLTDAG